MGSYAQCWLDDLFLGCSKNDIDTELISLFRPQDKIVRSSPIRDLPSHLEHYKESLSEDPALKLVYYEAPTNALLDQRSAPNVNRLAVLNPFTMAKTVGSLAGLLNPAPRISQQYEDAEDQVWSRPNVVQGSDDS